MMSVAANYNPSLDEPHVVTASYHPSCQWRNRVLSYSIYRPKAPRGSLQRLPGPANRKFEASVSHEIGQAERLGQLAQAHIFAST
jgi:hypothetical protein